MTLTPQESKFPIKRKGRSKPSFLRYFCISISNYILLVAKTEMRLSEALALTPKDFDFSHQMLSICKTWDYKGNGGFLPTKNKSSVRKIQIDWQTVIQFSELVKGLPEDEPIFCKRQSLQLDCK